MTQRHLNRLVAQATGESSSTIDYLGFSIADPLDLEFDPEPSHSQADLAECRPIDKFLDWDEVDAQRYALASDY